MSQDRRAKKRRRVSTIEPEKIEWHKTTRDRDSVSGVLISIPIIIALDFFFTEYTGATPIASNLGILLFVFGLITGIMFFHKVAPSHIGISKQRLILAYGEKRQESWPWNSIRRCDYLKIMKRVRIYWRSGLPKILNTREHTSKRIMRYWIEATREVTLTDIEYWDTKL